MNKSPYTFDQLIGQEKAKKLLIRAVAQDKIGHAYLFRGPVGVGKKRLAKTFAGYLNCDNRHDSESCGTCANCQKIASGNHADFIEVKPQGTSIKIDQIRQLKKQLSYPNFEAQFRIVLLSDIQLMGREAANSLLKTLEEPPAQTILILTLTAGAEVLDTINSRCQAVSLTSLPIVEVSKIIEDEFSLSRSDAITVANIASGSLGRARLLADNKIIEFRRHLIETFLTEKPSQPECIPRIFNLAEKAAAGKEDLPDLLDLLSTWLRDQLLLINGSQRSIINQDILPLMQENKKNWQTDDIRKRLEGIDQARQQLKRNCNRALVCEVLFFGLL